MIGPDRLGGSNPEATRPNSRGEFPREFPRRIPGLNRYRLPNLPNPHVLYRITWVLLMPSATSESFGLVAVEAMVYGSPVLASDHGALPETLGDAGSFFTIPERCTPSGDVVPTVRRMIPGFNGVAP